MKTLSNMQLMYGHVPCAYVMSNKLGNVKVEEIISHLLYLFDLDTTTTTAVMFDDACRKLQSFCDAVASEVSVSVWFA